MPEDSYKHCVHFYINKSQQLRSKEFQITQAIIISDKSTPTYFSASEYPVGGYNTENFPKITNKFTYENLIIHKIETLTKYNLK